MIGRLGKKLRMCGALSLFSSGCNQRQLERQLQYFPSAAVPRNQSWLMPGTICELPFHSIGPQVVVALVQSPTSRFITPNCVRSPVWPAVATCFGTTSGFPTNWTESFKTSHFYAERVLQPNKAS
jgi:hypothetical protein